MTEKQQAAVALFESGSVNCAQAVLCAFAPELGMDKDTLARLASGFGGGVGRLRGMCGAVSGMCMAASMLYGYGLEDSDEQKAATYAVIQRLVKGFEAAHGTINCGELMRSLAEKKEPTPTPRTEEFYATRPCSRFVATAAALLEAYIAEQQA